MRVSQLATAFPGPEPAPAPAADEDAVRWYFVPGAGVVQGPLEMASFGDRSLLVTLEPGQVGLLARAGEIRAVLHAGEHLLRVGSGPGRIDPAARLIVLETGRPLAVSWDESPRSDFADPAHSLPGGSAAIAIVDPVRFHGAFLRNAETCGEPFLTRLIGTLVQAHLTGILAAALGSGRRASPSPADAAAVRERLTHLAPTDLDAGLEGYGIACTALAWSAAAPGRAPAGTRATAGEADPSAADGLHHPDALVPA